MCTTKIKLSLCLTKNHAIKKYWGVEVQLHAFLSLVLNGGGWVCVGPRFGLDAVTNRKIPFQLLSHQNYIFLLFIQAYLAHETKTRRHTTNVKVKLSLCHTDITSF